MKNNGEIARIILFVKEQQQLEIFNMDVILYDHTYAEPKIEWERMKENEMHFTFTTIERTLHTYEHC